MKIVAGKHGGRTIEAPRGRNTRPTAARTREALFNMLAHGVDLPGVDGPGLSGARVADVFAGTGALGLEALSRGAAFATFVESHAGTARLLKANLDTLNEAANAAVLTCKADAVPPPPFGPVDVAFLDAPYDRGLSEPALAALAGRGWLKPESVAVVEIAAREALTPPPGFAVEKEKSFGAARVVFLRWGG